MKDLFDFNNFWLIWICCAGSKDGTSLFRIQSTWGIRTNYLYHKETSLNKPLFEAMLEKGYLKRGKKGLVSDFEWIPSYILKRHKLKSDVPGWSLNSFIVETIPDIHKFIKEYSSVLFDMASIKGLYQSDLNTIKRNGSTIFDDILLYVFISNLIPFCKRYEADIVIRMLYTFFSFSTEKDFLSYFYVLNNKLKSDAIPIVIPNEGQLVDVLCPLNFSEKDKELK
ncbi:MAG: hypothetical protein KAS90_03015 [Candidatus Aenigmarchaeota archaeon]|nr:hypothetical protein [Candidatus Aenigmarchaeota archaeon]